MALARCVNCASRVDSISGVELRELGFVGLALREFLFAHSGVRMLTGLPPLGPHVGQDVRGVKNARPGRNNPSVAIGSNL
jgi:hypothetical protein